MISVCMATYNGKRFIFKQIESILSQLKNDDELIISDNGSDDGTVEIINSFCDKRIKILTQARDLKLLKSFKGAEKSISRNFENALKQAKGEYIFLSDQDDIWGKNKVSESIKYLQEYDLVMSNAKLINSDDTIVKETLYSQNPINKNVLSFRHRGCLMAFNRNVLSLSLPFPKNLLYHDYWLGILAESTGRTLFIDQTLILHRRGIGNISTDITQKSLNSLFHKLSYRVIYLLLCIKRIIQKKLYEQT